MSIFNKKSEKVTPSVKIERVDITKLHTKLYFQNEPNEVRVNSIAENFDWNLFQPLDVSYRDGKYNVVDGQNRLYGALKKFKDIDKIITVPCLVRYGLTESDEMELFVKLAELRRHVPIIEIYKALYGSGNEFVVSMVNAIKDVGLIFDFKSTNKNGRITAVKTIHNIYGELGQVDFKNYLKLLYSTWNGDVCSLKADMLRGLFEFYKRYSTAIDGKRFTIAINKYTTPQVLLTQGKLHKRTERGIGIEMYEAYNKGLKDKTKKLPERLWG